MRLSFRPSCAAGSYWSAPKRSEIVLPIEGLLVAVGAHPLPIGEAYQLVFHARTVDRAHQLGRALEPFAILRLSDAYARRREHEQRPIKKAAPRREQRDEEHPFNDYGPHCFASPGRDSARQRLSPMTWFARKG